MTEYKKCKICGKTTNKWIDILGDIVCGNEHECCGRRRDIEEEWIQSAYAGTCSNPAFSDSEYD